MNDQLIYQVVLETDQASVKRVQEQLNAINQQATQAMQEAQVKALGGERVEALEKVKKAQGEGVKSLIELQKQMESYRADLKVLAVQEQIQRGLTEEQATTQQELKVALKAASAEYNRQQRDIIALSSSTNTLESTYDGLVAQNKALSIEMRKVPLDDTSGRLAKLQAQYKANNDRLKEFDKTLGNNQRNVGNYADAVDGLSGKLNGLPGPVGRVGSALGSLSAIMRANPIGLIITALAALVATLTRVQAVTDAVSVVFQGLNATLNVVGARVATFIGAIGKLFKGEFREAGEALKATFTGVGEEITEVYKAGVQAEQLLQRLRRDENAALVETARLTRDIAQARLDAQDAELDTATRLDAINKAIELTKSLGEVERRVAVARLRQAERKLQTDTDDLELQTQVAQARAELIRVDEQIANRQRELFERRTSLTRKLVTEEAKAAEQRVAIEQAMANQLQRIRGTLTASIQAEREKDFADFVQDSARRAEIAERDAKNQIEIQKKINAEKIAQEQAYYNIAFSLARAFFGDSKAVAIAQTIVDTYRGAQSAFSQTPGGPFTKSLAAAAAIAQGLARVRQIQSTNIGSSSVSTASASTPVTLPPQARDTVISSSAQRAASIGAPSGGGISITANLDRRGLAIAVRQGEAEIKSEQITFLS
jgi:hypothetical protein